MNYAELGAHVSRSLVFASRTVNPTPNDSYLAKRFLKTAAPSTVDSQRRKVRFSALVFHLLEGRWQSIRDDSGRTYYAYEHSTASDFRSLNNSQAMDLKSCISEHEFTMNNDEFQSLVRLSARAKAQLLVKDLGGDPI